MRGDPDGLIDMYLGSLSRPARSTVATYATALKLFSGWCDDEGLTVKDCARGDIARWLRASRQGSRTEVTVSQHASNVRRFYNWAAREGHVPVDPTIGVVGKEVRSQARVHFVTKDDLRRLVAVAMSDPNDAALLLLFCLLGLSPGEVASLQVGDFRRTPGGAHLSVRTASRSSRTLEVPPMLEEVLAKAVGSRSRGALLLNQWGKDLKPHNMKAVVTRLAKQAGVSPPALSEIVASVMHLAIAEGFSFVEVVRAHPATKLELLLPAVAQLPPARRPASFRMAALLRPDPDSNAALLDQAEALAYADVHVAVQVMIAGAVLERHMRKLAEEHDVLKRQPKKPDGTGITTWTGPLTGAKVLSPDDFSDAKFVADRRNEAAHGHLELITPAIAADVLARTRKLLAAHPVSVPIEAGPSTAPARRRSPLAGQPVAVAPDRAVSRRKRRDAIPDRVKIYVWQRDQGRCVTCGTTANLEYDHIIPRSLGGSDTARNLQLLCALCNGAKGGKLA